MQLHLAISPPARAQFGMAYNALTSRIILFGGIVPSGSNYNDTWSFYSGSWHNITSSAGRPPARHSEVMVYDAKDGCVMMFGGSHQSGGGQPPIGDTWKFQNGFWSQIGSCGGPSQPGCSVAPSPRYHVDAAFDAAANKVLLFGGSLAIGVGSDTWTYQGGVWSNLSAKIGTSPRPQAGGAMAYVSDIKQVVLFGGENGTGIPLNVTWGFSSGKWKHVGQIGHLSPAARFDEVLAYNSSGKYLLMFGGDSCWPPTPGCVFNDTWDFFGSTWVARTNLTPSARWGSGLVYDGHDGYVFLFGGDTQVNPNFVNDSWGFKDGVWGNLSIGHAPSPRAFAAMVYDAKDQYVLLFGGADNSPNPLGDTWEYSSGVWKNISPPVSPTARYTADITYDAKDGYVVLQGGYAPGSGLLSDTWKFAGGVWTLLTPPVTPPSSSSSATTYDSADGYGMIFGGTGSGGYPFLNTSWTFSGGNWTNITPPGSPPSRELAAMTFDGKDHYVVMFGGYGACGAYCGDTWTYSAGLWKNASTATNPPVYHTYPPAMTYDTADGYVLMFQLHYGPGSLMYDETWIYSGGTWLEII